MPNVHKILIRWLPFAVLSIIFAGLVQVTVQQNYRMSANDPQIQIAEDVAGALNAGNPIENVFAGNIRVDATKSLAPFVIAFDGTGKIIASTVSFGSQTLTPPPAGVFDAKQWGKSFGPKDQNRFTWQPKAGVRIAAVMTKYHTDKLSGYVLAGRSLQEVENRESQLIMLVGLGLLASLFGSLAVIWGLEYWKKRMKHD